VRVFNRDIPKLTKPMWLMLLSVGILFGSIFGYKAFSGYMMRRYMASHHSQLVYVSVKEAVEAPWEPQLKASGSLRAIVGVDITTQLAGMVDAIHFKPGSMVKKGDLLVQLVIDPDVAQLHNLEASAELAKITYKRDTAQYAIRAISKATLDTDEANYKATKAQVAQQKAIIEQKTIRAPFSGRLGISAVNPGQYLNPGDKVTMLQTLDPIYVDFFVPQQSIDQLKVGQSLEMTVDAFPGKSFTGKITTINPGVDANVRNVEVEATIPNPTLLLAPGMFSSVTVQTGEPKAYLTLPQTAISFNPYGSTVFIVNESGKDAENKPILTVTQAFVTTGEKRGDQVVILKGIKKGDRVVTSGQLKLQNGSMVAIDNTIVPTDEVAPMPVDE
jgi:membrane fusion protein (multidrug efflux system)